jgi:DNA-binding NtrC family response regulator
MRKDPHVRLLFMSGYSVQGTLGELIRQSEAGPHTIELLSKPFGPEQLNKAVRRTLDRQARTVLSAEVKENGTRKSESPLAVARVGNGASKTRFGKS